jgi:hypothetical protein
MLAPMLLALGGCDDDSGTGKLSLAITDAPVDGATAVVVQFTGVEVKPADGSARSFTFDAPRQIDLLALTGTDSELLLDEVEVPAGRYNWVRLAVDADEDGVTDSYIDLDDGSRHELEVPSGAETGLKLVSGFRVPAGGEASFTLDFDLRKSVHEPMGAGDSFKLRPTLRIVDNDSDSDSDSDITIDDEDVPASPLILEDEAVALGSAQLPKTGGSSLYTLHGLWMLLAGFALRKKSKHHK